MHHMKHPIIVFDLDGTLADTAPDLIGTLNVIMAREGLAGVPLTQSNELIGAGAKALIERGFLVNGKSLSAKRHDELFVDFIEHYGQNLKIHSQLFDGVEAALDLLKSDGWLLAVCTNKIEKHSKALLHQFGIADRFASICGRDTFPVFKPDPQHLLLTIAQAGGDATRAIMIGDSKADIDTAIAAKIPSIGVPFGYTDIPMHKLGATHVIQHFDELHSAVSQIAASFTPVATTQLLA
jgi:phosphoglycolate phosphatase